jgi:hypothetical protein
MLMQSHDRGRHVDWSLIIVVIMAGLIFAAAMIRSSAAGFGPAADAVGGIMTLPPQVRLIAVQDFNLNTTGWSVDHGDSVDPGFGPILGRFTDDVVSRSFDLPAGTTVADINFDLHAIDGWQLEAVIITLNDTVVMERSFSTDPAMINQQETLLPETPGVTVTPITRIAGAPIGFAAMGVQTNDQTLNINIAVQDPGSVAMLTITSTLSGPVFTASWAIDNLRVIATLPEDAT